jgi:hypothetical protein
MRVKTYVNVPYKARCVGLYYMAKIFPFWDLNVNFLTENSLFGLHPLKLRFSKLTQQSLPRVYDS